MDAPTRPITTPSNGAMSPTAAANRPVDYLDLKRYAGVWHEIAHLPMRYEKQCSDSVTATYRPLEDGTIEVRNACRTGRGFFDERLGVARTTDVPGALKVRFAPRWLSWLPFVWADYWVVGLDPAYQWAIVGGPSKRYLWILSRTPRMRRALFLKLAHSAETMGYDTRSLLMTSVLA